MKTEAHFLTREERLTTNRLSGIMIGWMGVAVLIGMGLIFVGLIAIDGRLLIKFKPQNNPWWYEA